jgi:hypothetical protein
MKINAKKEFLKELQGKADLKCVSLYYENISGTTKTLKLAVGFTSGGLSVFLENLDFEYNDGYGGQELFGTIWLKDGTWFTRGEHAGSEWWVHHECPDIPSELVNDKNK